MPKKSGSDPNNVIISEHDKTFKAALSNVRVARDFLEAHLPKDLLAVTDLEHLELQDRNFLNELREEAEVDVLYKTLIDGREAYLYLLLEHQSSIDKLMPFRVLKYIVHVMDRHVKLTGKKVLPLVYPLVVYHGRKKWPYSTDIREIVDAPKEFIDRFFLKPFHLIDLGHIDDEELKRHATAGVVEFIFKHIHDWDMLPAIREAADLMRRIVEGGGRDVVAIMLQYALSRGEISKDDEFYSIIREKISPEVEETVMSLAQKIKQEGIQEGIREGIREGIYKNQLQTAISMLAEGADPKFVARHTKLTAEEVGKLLASKPLNDENH